MELGSRGVDARSRPTEGPDEAPARPTSAKLTHQLLVFGRVVGEVNLWQSFVKVAMRVQAEDVVNFRFVQIAEWRGFFGSLRYFGQAD
jgi:hypothetical protein